MSLVLSNWSSKLLLTISSIFSCSSIGSSILISLLVPKSNFKLSTILVIGLMLTSNLASCCCNLIPSSVLLIVVVSWFISLVILCTNPLRTFVISGVIPSDLIPTIARSIWGIGTVVGCSCVAWVVLPFSSV